MDWGKQKQRFLEIVLGEQGWRREEVKRMIGTIWRLKDRRSQEDDRHNLEVGGQKKSRG